MRTAIILCALVGACSSTPPAPAPVVYREAPAKPSHFQEMVVQREVHPMDRSASIEAVQECRNSNMRPRMIYSYTVLNGQRVPVVIDVICSSVEIKR